jgi:hypothetical protein
LFSKLTNVNFWVLSVLRTTDTPPDKTNSHEPVTSPQRPLAAQAVLFLNKKPKNKFFAKTIILFSKFTNVEFVFSRAIYCPSAAFGRLGS